jgi:hypothetical protein
VAAKEGISLFTYSIKGQVLLVECDVKEEKEYAAVFNIVMGLRKNNVQYVRIAVHVKSVRICLQYFMVKIIQVSTLMPHHTFQKQS